MSQPFVALHCILPPYLLERLAHATDARTRDLAIRAIALAAEIRATRATLASVPLAAAIPSPTGRKHRLVYDARHGSFQSLPGTLVRAEGARATKDAAVDEAYTHSGATYDFYKRVFGRNSLDGRGMSLISSVHLGRRYNNAFWTGQQMAYGDGDGSLFVRFTRALDVVGHELTHGVVAHTCNLEYRDEPGALNEHFADVMGALVRQWRRKQDAASADWRVGVDIMGPGTTAACLRTFEAGLAFEDDPWLGTDPQPKHLRDKYKGGDDNGGVHINSGIPNHAFYLVARALGGRAWERAGRIWYKSLVALTRTSRFADLVAMTEQVAAAEYGVNGREQKAVVSAWKAVGF
jgi:Zn-dependent metalloprotease